MTVTKEGAKTLRTYFTEVVVLALASAVCYLFVEVNDLNRFIRTTLYDNSIQMQRTIEKNSFIIEKINK